MCLWSRLTTAPSCWLLEVLGPQLHSTSQRLWVGENRDSKLNGALPAAATERLVIRYGDRARSCDLLHVQGQVLLAPVGGNGVPESQSTPTKVVLIASAGSQLCPSAFKYM